MAITELLRTVPNPFAPRRPGRAAEVDSEAGVVAIPTYGSADASGANASGANASGADVPLPEELWVPDLSEVTPPWTPLDPTLTDLPSTVPEGFAGVATQSASRVPLSSRSILAVGSLAVSVLAALAAFALLLASPQGPAISVGSDAEPAAAVPLPDEPSPDGLPASGSAAPAVGTAEPRPIPAEMTTRLEAASDDALSVELVHLLAAIEHGFGTDSARLEPTLRSYVYRMASRFEWNPDTFRVAVSAPSGPLASARADLFRRLFPVALASNRLQIESSIGPHALTLVSE